MLHLKNLMGLLFLASVVMLSLFLLVPTVQANTPDLPEGVSQGDWQTIAAQVSAHRHQIVAAADGFQARNPDQQWLMHFDGQGFEVTPQGADWTWGLSLKSYGRNGAEQAVTGKPAIRAEGNRQEALQTAWRHLLLSEAAGDVLARTLAFGGTLIFNRSNAVSYGGALQQALRDLFRAEPGIAGLIIGIGLAQGYWRDEAKTNASFFLW